jgi:hypothetical protein
MPVTSVLRWFRPKSDPPIVETLIVEREEELALRNQQRLEQAKRTLGERYVLHQSNKVTRQQEEQPRMTAARALLSDKLRKLKGGVRNERTPETHAAHLDRL